MRTLFNSGIAEPGVGRQMNLAKTRLLFFIWKRKFFFTAKASIRKYRTKTITENALRTETVFSCMCERTKTEPFENADVKLLLLIPFAGS